MVHSGTTTVLITNSKFAFAYITTFLKAAFPDISDKLPNPCAMIGRKIILTSRVEISICSMLQQLLSNSFKT
jgi:hypothetical protein